MASIGITACVQRGCSSSHLDKRRLTPAGPLGSLGAKQMTNVVTPNVEFGEKQEKSSTLVVSDTLKGHSSQTRLPEARPRFSDERWKNGTWDLNMFVKQGRMDWDALIVAEAKRRKFLEAHPEASKNEEPVVFRSSIIPWWAWMVHSHLPEAERLNGQAAMLGFFMAYLVDALTGLDVVGQTGNFTYKAAVFAAVVGVLLFRRKEDIGRVRKLVEEATFYDRQWQASWQKTDAGNALDEESSKSH